MLDSSSKIDMKVEIAIQLISSKLQLWVKSGEKEIIYHGGEEIAHVLSIIQRTLGIGFDNELLLQSMHAEILNMKLPLQKSIMREVIDESYQKEEFDIYNMIENSQFLKSIIIARSYFETLALLTEKDDKWKFFMPIDAKVTSFQAIRHLQSLASIFTDVDWIVGNSSKNELLETGFLFVIKNSKVTAICLDDFDLVLFKEQFINSSEIVLDILSPNNMNNSFYIERAQSSEAFIKSIELDLHENLNIQDYGLQSFKEIPNVQLNESLELACDLRSSKEINFIATVAKFALQESNELIDILVRAGYSLTDHKFDDQKLYEESKIQLINSVGEIIANQNPLSFKIILAIRVMNTIIEGQESHLQGLKEKLKVIIEDIISDQNSTDELKNNIKAYDNIDIKKCCAGIRSVLESYENNQENNNRMFHTKMLHFALISDSSCYMNDILKRYINRISLNENIFGSAKIKFFQHLENEFYNRLILNLSKCSSGVKYFIVRKGLENYSASDNRIIAIGDLLDQLTNSEWFNETHWQDIWRNNRFQFLIRTSSDEPRIIYKVFNMGCNLMVSDYIPQDITQKVNKLIQQDNDSDLPDRISDFDEFSKIIRSIKSRIRLPDNFRQVLTESIKHNKLLYENLEKCGILRIFKWDGVFMPPIGIEDIEKAINLIDSPQLLNECLKKNVIVAQKKLIGEKLSNITFDTKSEIGYDLINLNRISSIHQNFVNVYGNSVSFLNYEEFIRLNTILEKSLLENKNSQQCVMKILPYIIQKMKMWGCNATTADNISSLITIEPELSKNDSFIGSVYNSPRFKTKEIQDSSAKLKIENEVRTPLSRLDVITGVLNTADVIVSQDILNIMAKFPLALPLIIKELHDKDSYKNLMPWLTQPIIKWESSPGKIIENHLFVDKFKMIVALRIGETSGGRSGKSTILNQTLSAKYMFSCCGEPGAKRGKPSTLNGSVEFVWLTQETSSPKLWESVLQKHYESGFNEIILLANIHGNPLTFENHLKSIRTFASSYIFFIMPENNENIEYYWNKLKEILGIGDEENKIFYVAIDPSSEDQKLYPEELIINTSRITDDSYIEKLRKVLKNCLTNPGRQIDVKTLKSFGKTKISELIETKESTNLIKFIEQNTCRDVKEAMFLQRSNKTYEQCMSEWLENDKHDVVIRLMGEVLLLERESRLKAMIHIEKQLNRISTEESLPARKHYSVCLSQLHKMIGASGNDLVIVGQKKKQVMKALEDLDKISLGLEHFYREIGKLYEIILADSPKNNPYINLAKRYAELFIEGQAIELLNGDSGELVGPWLSAIFGYVYEKIPGMRIFVVSILGLQSSGKSTLLNALFACKFAVSVGRCTRGLFMRLLFLDEKLKNKSNYDAILLIDTEGLGAPEKQNEPDAERKDRIMATFAMGISHLTIVNVLGEYMRDLTEILQIAIVAMARLEKADVSPDILIVQHLTERNSDKMTNASKQFGEALEKAINIADEKDVDLGIRDSKSLNILRSTISTGNLFRQFRPFKNGASVYSPPSDEYHQDVVDLYEYIMDIAEKSTNKADLINWELLIHSYWDSIKEENFMRFKDVKDLQEYCIRGEIMTKVKESIESAFREHSEILKRFFIREQAKNMNEHKVSREIALKNLKDKLNLVPLNCPDTHCMECKECIKKQSILYSFVAKKPSEDDTKLTVLKFINKTREWHFNQLSQMMDAIAIRQIESAGTIEKIEKRLKSLLNNNEKFSEEEISKLTDNVWHDIEKEAAERVTLVSVHAQISSEIPRVYQEKPEFITNLRYSSIQTLKGIPAIHRNLWQEGKKLLIGGKDFLEINQVYDLESKILGLSEILLKEDNAKNYQTGMVAKLKRKVENIIKNFEKTNELKLKSDFKWTLHSFANQRFNQNMSEKQEKWDEEHNPLTILHKNKSQYIKLITERLRHGFTYESEGLIVGNQLLDAIQLKALKTVNENCILEVLRLDWLSNSESVRLKYFSKLVEQVKNNNFIQSLKHFKDPKYEIERWFKNEVNHLSKIQGKKKINEYFKLELNRVKQKMRDSTSINEISTKLGEYIASYEMKFYENSVPNRPSTTNLEIFRTRIIEVLNDDKKASELISKAKLTTPSCDKRVMDRMGCTSACPLCCALCWGQRGHNEDEGETSRHHTCHQPMGLSQIHNYYSKKLACSSCDNQNYPFIIKGQPIIWSKVITLDGYKDWKYETHVIKKFNDMMKWFFFKLNEDIARNSNCNPPDIEEIEKYGLHKLNIGKIMAVINSRTNRSQS